MTEPSSPNLRHPIRQGTDFTGPGCLRLAARLVCRSVHETSNPSRHRKRLNLLKETRVASLRNLRNRHARFEAALSPALNFSQTRQSGGTRTVVAAYPSCPSNVSHGTGGLLRCRVHWCIG